MVQEGSVDALGGVPIWKGGEAGLLSPIREFFGFHTNNGEREER